MSVAMSALSKFYFLTNETQKSSSFRTKKAEHATGLC